MNKRILAAVLGAAALAFPAAAIGDSDHGDRIEKSADKAVDKAKKTRNVKFVFKGTFVAGTVEVLSGNAHVRKGGFVGQAVTFDFASAKIVVADTNADQSADLADVVDGDRVVVRARVAKGTMHVAPADGEPAAAIAARKLIDKTHAPGDDEEPAPAL